MEISENVENHKHQRNSGVLHSTQSQPILLDCEENTQENKDKSAQKRSSKRRVSFASSSQLTQFLEPLNPFESFGKEARIRELKKERKIKLQSLIVHTLYHKALFA